MPRIQHRPWRTPTVLATLLAAFVAALLVPIPSLPDPGRATVRAEVEERLPGWRIQRLAPSWEGGYTVVTRCAGRHVGFQFVPGHGLPADDAWIQPSNDYARERLASLSDHRRYLLWRGDPIAPASLSCRQELARSGATPGEQRIFD